MKREHEELCARLDGYNPPDRTFDDQRQASTDIHDAAAAIRELSAEVEIWYQRGGRYLERANEAEAELAKVKAHAEATARGYELLDEDDLETVDAINNAVLDYRADYPRSEG